MPVEKTGNMQSHLDNLDNALSLGDLVLLELEQNMSEKVFQHEVSCVSCFSKTKAMQDNNDAIKSICMCKKFLFGYQFITMCICSSPSPNTDKNTVDI